MSIYPLSLFLNSLSTNFTKWSNTLKQFVVSSVFDHFVGLALNGLMVLSIFSPYAAYTFNYSLFSISDKFSEKPIKI